MTRLFDGRLDDDRPDSRDGSEAAGSRAVARLLAAAVTMLLVSFLVVGRSNAAFDAGTSSTAASLAPGRVELLDDDEEQSLFQLPAMAPGRTYANCITVGYSGTVLPAQVRLQVRGGGTLASYLDLTVEVGAGGDFGKCDGFRPGGTMFTGTLADLLVTGYPGGSPLDAFTARQTGDGRTFRFSFTLRDSPDSQGLRADVEFLWSARP